MRKILSLIEKNKNWFIASIIISVIISICDIFSVDLTRQLVNGGLQGNSSKLYYLSVTVLILILVSVTSKYCITYCNEKILAYSTEAIRNKFIFKIHAVSIETMEKYHSGDILSRINNDVSDLSSFIADLSTYVYQILFIIVSVIYLGFMNWKLLIITALCIVGAIIISRFNNNSLQKDSQEYYKSLGEENKIVQDTINGIDIQKAFNLEKTFSGWYKQKLDRTLTLGLKVSKQFARSIAFGNTINELPQLLSILCALYFAVKGTLTPAEVIAFTQLLVKFTGQAKRLPYIYANYKKNMGLASRVFQFLDEKIEEDLGMEFYENNEEAAIEFNNVNFSYGDHNILNNISFQLPKGSTVALVGKSGCGKSTILDLICNFYKLEIGTIKIFGQDIKDIKLSSLRENISLVTQHSFLFSGTVKENILLGKENSTHDEIVAAAKLSRAHDFISTLKDGYETDIGEKGYNLSGGQRQRLSMARAMLKDSPILLLDEPTSALDTQSEALLQAALENYSNNRTVLVVAHRLSTIKKANIILVMDEGTIVERGNHEELIRKGGIYAKLYNNRHQNLEVDDTKDFVKEA